MTCNIEGIKTNIAYLHTIELSNTVLCIQEHFLWEFQKKEMKRLLPSMENHTRCADSVDPIDGFRLPRGKGGVSILWPTKWANRIKKLNEGNERIIAVLIAASIDICLINAYMPTHNTDSQYEYTECLDIIFDIIQKYQDTHKIVLAGDLNGTLQTSRANKHDKLLRKFVEEMNLTTGTDLMSTPTFFHHAGSSTSQIDYILVQDKAIIIDYKIEEKSYANTSAHTAVKLETKIQIPQNSKSKHQNRSARYKLQWDQMDHRKYNNIIKQDIISIMQEEDIDKQVEQSIQTMVNAGKSTIPVKLLQMKGPKWKASPEVLTILNSCREMYRKWQSVGKSKCHQLAEDLKKEKKKLRSKLRIEQALDRQKLYQQIMDNPNTQLFYRLIKRNRNNSHVTTNCLKIGEEYVFRAEDQRKSFAQYYEDFSLPKEDQYDSNYLNLCRIRQNCIQEVIQECTDSPQQFSDLDVEKAIDCLNNKKSPDEFGLTAEHLKNAKTTIAPALRSIFNNILQHRKVPSSFKSGILTPVLKKDKDPTMMSNYRAITVTALIGKVFEYTFLHKLNLKSKSDLQFGFTEGLSPIMSSLIISEARYENKKVSENFYMTILDVKSAFDVVQHDILMDKLWNQDLHPVYWKILTELYDGLSSKVKWLDGYSSPFNIKQGVRQGGILSTHLYKIFVQDLLEELEQKAIGYQLGNIYVGTPTCADDIAFISNNRYEMQLMLNVLNRYAKEHHYSIHPTKTQIIDCSKNKSNYRWTLDGNIVQIAESGVHLGLIRSENNESSINIQERIQTARRTRYALMGSGVHGTNGIDPPTSYQIYRTYVIPRLIYGLEVLPLTKGNIDQLEKFHRKNLRQIQSLPERTSNSAALLLLGALPIEAEIHKRSLSLLFSLITCDNGKIQDILNRQVSTNFDNKKSYFSRMVDVLEMYELPSIIQLQNNIPKKESWKKDIKERLSKFWTKKLMYDARNKSSLKFMSVDTMEMGKTHLVWNLRHQPRLEHRKAIVKARVMTGTYIFQTDKHKFTHYNVEPICQLCCRDNEDVIHFLTTCPVLSLIREKYFPEKRKEIMNKISPEKWNSIFRDKNTISQLIIDCTKYKDVLGDEKLMDWIEQKTRNLIFQLHINRLKIQEANGK